MSKSWDGVTHLYDNKGNFLGVMIAPDVWEKTKHKVAHFFEQAKPAALKVLPEPMEDWESLKAFWDFKYPINKEVFCENCQSCTNDWEADSPRKFRLMACNIGGLARFECQECHGLVTKRHFKDEIQCVCTACEDR